MLGRNDDDDGAGACADAGESKEEDGAAMRSSSRSGLKAGDKVEAQCKGSRKQYPGTIMADNRDGTFDVKFDDGDRDREVPERSITKVSGDRASARGDERALTGSGGKRGQPGSHGKLEVGDKVEARCKGSRKPSLNVNGINLLLSSIPMESTWPW